ncbi:hypothetical protein [Myxococcus llanfairpwllgwyngyllgogerychwyrndrobwllllantysiliogogogochensis]|uniref:hypothetical protein n=1 Tax=Myxococcus llanfairpwllgwyngyllgogerychwyrndrobwllllantysiliogogogochensis TaxID=2590453 RepID=UPI0015F06917|nr:hypothetical protein [Myxococcus llanfairpwllgwyngyllgogerychwyrndrobwllllantysiliogogogochensis]
MTSIRRLSSSILSSLRRTSLDVDTSVSPLTQSESLDPVSKIRRGYSDESDFQADGADGADALLSSFDPDEAEETGSARNLDHASLRVFSGESSFEPAAPRYAQVLGSQLPSALGAPRDTGGGVGRASRRGGADAPDASDILSPDEAAWELHNLDTSSPSVDAPEDLLFMMDPPGSSGRADPMLDLNLDLDSFEDSPSAIGGVMPGGSAVEGLSAARYASGELMGASVRPAGPEEFLADLSDLGDLVPEEEFGPADAALAGVLGSLAANPVAASVPVVSALGAQGVDVVADAVELQPDAQPAEPASVLGQFLTEQSAMVGDSFEESVAVAPSNTEQASAPGETFAEQAAPQEQLLAEQRGATSTEPEVSAVSTEPTPVDSNEPSVA